jgi:hypothetical protein
MKNNDKYIIVDIINKKFFLDVNGNVKVFNDYNNALLNCGIYELENAWVCPLIHNHIEDNQLDDNQLAMIKKQNDKQ